LSGPWRIGKKDSKEEEEMVWKIQQTTTVRTGSRETRTRRRETTRQRKTRRRETRGGGKQHGGEQQFPAFRMDGKAVNA
jgi:hypothetical protein